MVKYHITLSPLLLKFFGIFLLFQNCLNKYLALLCLTKEILFESRSLLEGMTETVSLKLRAGIRLKYLHYRHIFQTSQLRQKMIYRVEILRD